MKTKYRLFIALLYGSYTIPVMFSYCFIGSTHRSGFLAFMTSYLVLACVPDRP